MRNLWAGVVSALLLAGAAVSQKMTVTGGSVLMAGQGVQINYADPSRAGQTINVQVDDGMPKPTIVTLQIQLDQNGQGCAQWLVQPWWRAAFNAPGVEQVTRAID
jgi:hypothetical protein